MIKREHIKQAISAIAARDAEIGYALDEMLAMGVIDVPPGSGDEPEENRLFFLFEGQKVPVNKILYFNEGTVPIERGLLIKYGELAKRQEILDRKESIRYQESSKEIRAAGLRLLVAHEINYAISRIRGKSGIAPKANERLEEIRGALPSLETALKRADDAAMFLGLLDGDTKALFAPFPICMESLMQVADINLEFFHVRFILECVLSGLENNLFACVVESRVVGMVYLVHKSDLFGRDLEIRFLASLGDAAGEQTHGASPPPRGVGTFLVAGVWMLWKKALPSVKRIILDAEVGARRFYASLGFEPTGPTGYALKQPKGYLFKAVLVMTRHCRNLSQDVIKEIEKIIRKRIKSLRKKGRGETVNSARKALVVSIKECLISEARPEFAKTAIRTLLKYGEGIPEFNELIRFGLKHASIEIKAYIQNAARTSS